MSPKKFAARVLEAIPRSNDYEIAASKGANWAPVVPFILNHPDPRLAAFYADHHDEEFKRRLLAACGELVIERVRRPSA